MFTVAAGGAAAGVRVVAGLAIGEFVSCAVGRASVGTTNDGAGTGAAAGAGAGASVGEGGAVVGTWATGTPAAALGVVLTVALGRVTVGGTWADVATGGADVATGGGAGGVVTRADTGVPGSGAPARAAGGRSGEGGVVAVVAWRGGATGTTGVTGSAGAVVVRRGTVTAGLRGTGAIGT
jgi:hypothetical protein